VSTPTATWRAQAGNTSAKVTLYLKIYDVSPDGSRGAVGAISSPVRIDDTRTPVTVNLQGIVHRFEAGHRIGFAVSGSDLNFRGGTTPALVTIDAGVNGETLSLPIAE
jgi:predicted acyl esterase